MTITVHVVTKLKLWLCGNQRKKEPGSFFTKEPHNKLESNIAIFANPNEISDSGRDPERMKPFCERLVRIFTIRHQAHPLPAAPSPSQTVAT